MLPGPDGKGLIGKPGRRLQDALPPQVVKRLERSGPLGRLLLAMASGIDPKVLQGRGPSLEVSDLVGHGRLAPASGVAPGRRVVGAAHTTNDASDGLFGVVLLGSAITLGGAAWMRRRAAVYPGA